MKAIVTLLYMILSLATAYAQPRDKVASTPALGHDWREGFINITELNAGLGLGSTNVPYSNYYFGITTVNGYQFSRNIKAGLGLGVDLYNEGVMIPLFFDARFSLNAQKYVPFASAAGGVELNPENLTGGSRIFINPGIGIKWVAASKIGVCFSSGLMVTSGGADRSSFINFKLGLEFKGK